MRAQVSGNGAARSGEEHMPRQNATAMHSREPLAAKRRESCMQVEISCQGSAAERRAEIWTKHVQVAMAVLLSG
jgi:hypothetical protein